MLGTMLTKEEIEDFMAEADKDGNGILLENLTISVTSSVTACASFIFKQIQI